MLLKGWNTKIDIILDNANMMGFFSKSRKGYIHRLAIDPFLLSSIVDY